MPAVSFIALAGAIRSLHGCDSVHRGSVWVAEEPPGRSSWIGRVHVFDLVAHPAASRCYAWGVPSASGRGFDCVTVLHEDDVDSPRAAVHAHLTSLESR